MLKFCSGPPRYSVTVMLTMGRGHGGMPLPPEHCGVPVTATPCVYDPVALHDDDAASLTPLELRCPSTLPLLLDCATLTPLRVTGTSAMVET